MEGIPGTRKTERRRSRSRSRQRIESELFKIITDIPAVNDTYEYLLSAYTLIKDSNPLFKESFERGEEMAYWMKDKTDRALSLTGLDQPLKQMDAKAAQSWEEAENMRRRISGQWESNQKLWESRIKEMSLNFQQKTDTVNYTVFESMQTIMDYFEESLENLMLPASEESEKFSQEPSFKMTVGRMLDLTYRLNVGILSLSMNKMKDLGDPTTWQTSFIRKHLDPRQISARAKIVSDEISNPEKVLGYLENKELTTVDRTLISTSRALLAASKNAVDQMNKGQTMAYGLMANIWTYNRQLFKQLGEAQSINDVTGIGLHETRRALELSMDNLALLKQSDVLAKTVDWMALQEENLAAKSM